MTAVAPAPLRERTRQQYVDLAQGVRQGAAAVREWRGLPPESRERVARTVDAFGGFVLRDKLGAPVQVCPVHQLVTAFVVDCWADGDYAGVLAPWGVGKTTWLPERLTLFELGRDHGSRVRIVSGGDEEAVQRVTAVRRYLTASVEYRLTFPSVHPARAAAAWAEWTKHSLFIERPSPGHDPSVSAAGVETQEAGGRYDVLLFDDVATYQNMILHPAKRATVLEALENVWLRRVDLGTRVVYTGTRWVVGDPPGAYLGRAGWRWLVLRVGRWEHPQARDRYTWEVVGGVGRGRFAPAARGELPPVPWHTAEFLGREAAKGRVSFDRGFCQTVHRADERMFGDLGQLLRHGLRLADVAPPSLPRYAGYDPAGQRRRGHALATVAADLQRGAYVVTELRLWSGSIDVTRGQLAAAAARNAWHGVGVESVGLQYPFVSMVMDVAPRAVVQGVVTGRNKADERTGIGAMAVLVGQGRFTLCLDDDYGLEALGPLAAHPAECECAYHVLIADLDNYPSEGRTYDLLMALWFAWGIASGRLLGERVQAEPEASGPPEALVLGDLGGVPAEELGGTLF